MRRKDREVTELNEIMDILLRCDTVRIGMQGTEFPYVVPVSFGATVENETVTVYFHCAMQGLKVDMLRNNNKVCVEGDILDRIEKTEHGITARYESVIGFGTCILLEDTDEMIRGLQAIVAHYGYPDYPVEPCLERMHLLVEKIVLDRITGKRNSRRISAEQSPAPAEG